MASSISQHINVVLKREEILELICEKQPEKRELVDTLSESRPTIDRAIRELEGCNLVQRTDGFCKPTYTGEIAYELCRDFKSAFVTLEKTDAELSSLPLDAGLDTAVFHDGSVFYPPDCAPYGKIQPMYEDLNKGDELVAITRVVLPPYIDQILSHGSRSQVDVDLVISNGVFDVLLENQQDLILPCIESGNTIYKIDELPPYSLFLIDNEILYVAIYSDTNHLSAVIRNTSPRAIQYSKNRISEIQKEAKLLTTGSLSTNE